MVSHFIKFKDSQVNKSVAPVPEVLNAIDLLETALFENGLIDESIETMLISSFHITYKKNGKDILMIRPFRSDWNIKLFGTNWDIQQLFSLQVTFEFEMEKTGWRLHGMMDTNAEEIKHSLLKAADISPINQLIVYPLSILQSYYLKNPFLFQSVNEEMLREVVFSYWEGNMEKIRKLSQESVNTNNDNQMNEFLLYWFKQSKVLSNLKREQIHDRMKVNMEGFLSILSSLNMYINNIFSNYKNSLSSIWLDSLTLKNKEAFHSKVEEIRETIILTETFLDEMKQIEIKPQNRKFVDNEMDIEMHKTEEIGPVKNQAAPLSNPVKQSSTILYPSDKYKMENKAEVMESDWFEIIIKNGGWVRDIPFRTKKDLYEEDSLISLSINEKRAEMLAYQLAKEKRMVKEFTIVIKLLIQHSNAQGYVTKEELKDLFMKEYQDEKLLSDYAMRYNVSKTHAHQGISTKFHVILEGLKKNGLIKEFFRNNSYQVYWNFAIFVHK